MIVTVIGVSGSGKTTVGKRLAHALDWPFHEGDDFHPESNKEKMARGEPLDDRDRAPWLEAIRGLIDGLEEERVSAVIACSALRRAYREFLRRDHPDLHFVYLKGSYELFHRRLQTRRGHFFKADLLRSQFETLEEPEHALTVDAAGDPGELVAEIRRRLGV